MSKKVKIARLSIISNTLLILLKLAAGFLSGSVSIISEAIHSMMDLVAAIIAFFSVRVSDNPPDKNHPYGHGKYENVSGVIEALLIFIAAGWIIYESVSKITSNEKVESLGIGTLVMLISAGVNFIVSRKLYKVAKETDSIALEADALHLKTDVLTSLGVAIGLALIWITGYTILDPLVAILVAVFIIKEAYILMKNAYHPLLDVSLTDQEIKIIERTVLEFGLEFHDLKSRKSGNYRFAEFHLEMDGNKTLEEVHTICDEIEIRIKTHISNIEITIHPETKKPKE